MQQGERIVFCVFSGSDRSEGSRVQQTIELREVFRRFQARSIPISYFSDFRLRRQVNPTPSMVELKDLKARVDALQRSIWGCLRQSLKDPSFTAWKGSDWSEFQTGPGWQSPTCLSGGNTSPYLRYGTTGSGSWPIS